jgi:hypothetical protein
MILREAYSERQNRRTASLIFNQLPSEPTSVTARGRAGSINKKIKNFPAVRCRPEYIRLYDELFVGPEIGTGISRLRTQPCYLGRF